MHIPACVCIHAERCGKKNRLPRVFQTGPVGSELSARVYVCNPTRFPNGSAVRESLGGERDRVFEEKKFIMFSVISGKPRTFDDSVCH